MKITDNIYLVASGKWGFGITQAIDCNVFLISTDEGCILIDSGTGLEPEKMDAVIESHGFSVKDIKAVVKDGETIAVGNITLTAYMCPGHSLQDMVIYGKIDGKNCLFSGDCVFAQGQVLIQALPDVSIFPYAEAMRRIVKLPIEAIFPGHGVFCLENGVSFVQAAVDKFNAGLIPPQLYYFA